MMTINSRKAAQEGIFRLDSVPAPKPEKTVITYFSDKGTKVKTEAKQAASQHKTGDTSVYFVKVNRKYKLYDPYTKETPSKSKDFDREPYKMMECSQVCFEYYLQYLKSSDFSYLTLSQKEISPSNTRNIRPVMMTQADSMSADEARKSGIHKI